MARDRHNCGVYEQIADRALQLQHPLDAIWELTYRCNLKCRHCYVLQSAENELNTSECMDVLKQLANAGVLFLTFTGGEPFLREDIFDLIAEARRLKFAVTVFTNGTLLGKEECKRLAEQKLQSVEISVYGAGDKTHDSITGVQGSYNSTMKAVEYLIESGARVVLKTCIMRENIDELPKLSYFCQQRGLRFRWSTFLSPLNNGDMSEIEKMRLTDAELRSILEKDFAGEEIESDFIQTDDSVIELNRMIPCSAGHTTFGILPDGTVLPCPQFVRGSDNIRDKSLIDIWRNSPEFRKIRQITAADFSVCNKCRAKSYCFRCQAVALLEDGDLFGPSSESCREAFLKMELHENKKKILSAGN